MLYDYKNDPFHSKEFKEIARSCSNNVVYIDQYLTEKFGLPPYAWDEKSNFLYSRYGLSNRSLDCSREEYFDMLSSLVSSSYSNV